MAAPGQKLFNPATGLTTTFIATGADTGGELLRLEWAAGPGWSAGPKHVHRLQEERFEVLAGEARSYVDGVERTHEPGDVFVAPTGAVHTVGNAADAGLRLLVEFRPALRSEDVLETLAVLAQEGRVRADGTPKNLLELALLVSEYEDELYLAQPPLPIQRALFRPLAAIGRRLGHSATRSVREAPPEPAHLVGA